MKNSVLNAIWFILILGDRLDPEFFCAFSVKSNSYFYQNINFILIRFILVIFTIFAGLDIVIAHERHHTDILFYVTNQLASAQKSWISIVISITIKNTISD